MKHRKRLPWFISLLFLFGAQITQASPIHAVIPLQAINDSMLIYYRLNSNGSDSCIDHPPMTLSDFIKKTLPFEWTDDWANTPGGIEALKAGAIAIRTFTISAYNADIINIGGQNYYCTKAWRHQGFNPSNPTRPNSTIATDATSSMIMIHPTASTYESSRGWPANMRTGAIDARYLPETGWYTSQGYFDADLQTNDPVPWLREVFDPISSGSPKTGMGQEGSRRWAWGANDSGQAFPKWDYRRILAHYYSEVDFVGISPDPPNDYRINIMETEGIPPNGGLIMCRGEELPGVVIHSQNVGNALPVDNSSLAGFCYSITNPQTLIGYHLYRPDGTLACSNCVGLRSEALCHPGGAMPPGMNQFSSDFKIFIPNDSAILKGQTYLLRFDLKRNGVWQGRNANFPWPPQDVPVTICTGSSGSGSPEVSVNRPPAVVTYANLVNGQYGFSWSGRNATGYDIDSCSREIGQAGCTADGHFARLYSNVQAEQISFEVNCDQDRLDWRFRLRGRNSTQTGNWVYIDSRTRVWPHPWMSYWSIGGLALNSDPGPWPRPLDVMNLGGGSFNWSASANQTWLTLTNSSGQGQSSLGLNLNKPGGNGDYYGTITLNMTNPSPSPFCNRNQPGVIPCTVGASNITCNIPVWLLIRETFNYYYLPLILKNN